jgi:hypothetical protein
MVVAGDTNHDALSAAVRLPRVDIGRNSKQEFVGLLNGVPQIYVHEDHCSAPRRLRGEK